MSTFRNSRLVRLYLRFLDRHPTKTMCLTTAALHAGGDVIAQKFIERKEQLEIVRTGRFFLIGLVWDGPLLSWWYRALSRALPVASKSTTVLKVALDQGLFIPGMLASFLVLNAGLKGMDKQDIEDILKRDYFQLLLANYQLWPLAMTLNFYLMPVKHQVLFTNSVSLAWNTYLSWKANQELLKTQRIASITEGGVETAKKDFIEDNLIVEKDGDKVKVGDKTKDKDTAEEEVEMSDPRAKLVKQVGYLTKQWNIDFLSHPYALLPR